MDSFVLVLISERRGAAIASGRVRRLDPHRLKDDTLGTTKFADPGPAASKRAAFPLRLSDCFPEFRAACVGIDLEAEPYQARQSGASIDMSSQGRSLEAVGKRGRWASSRTPRRYENRGRLNRSWNALAAAQQQHMRTCERCVSDVLLLGRAPPDYRA